VEAKIGPSRLLLLRGDITRQASEAIVNAANSSLMGGGGVDGAIHRAGGPRILEECKRIVARQGPLATGEAVITTGGNLPAKYVIHTVGPIWRGGGSNEAGLLASAYRESLKVAEDHGLTSVAFPSISTGAYGYPLEEAARIAIESVIAYLKGDSAIQEVRFVLFDAGALGVYERALREAAPAIGG
jgi:O-acetyl-ADP-ribose deacetylase (regulator of RNase III)